MDINDFMVPIEAELRWKRRVDTIRTKIKLGHFDEAIRKGLVKKSGPFAIEATDEQMRDPNFLKQNRGIWIISTAAMTEVYGEEPKEGEMA